MAAYVMAWNLDTDRRRAHRSHINKIKMLDLRMPAAEPHLITRRVLPRHKSNPCCKIPTEFEATRVCDGGSDGRGPHHANPEHGLEAAAHILGTMMGVNGTIKVPNLQFQSSELINNGLQRLLHRRWKSFVITLVRDDRRKLRKTFALRLRSEAANADPILNDSEARQSNCEGDDGVMRNGRPSIDKIPSWVMGV